MLVRRSAMFLLALPLIVSAGSVRIYQTNSAGDAVDIIDPTTNKVVMQIKDIEVPHGVSFSPDGTRAYISCEAENTVRPGMVFRAAAISQRSRERSRRLSR